MSTQSSENREAMISREAHRNRSATAFCGGSGHWQRRGRNDRYKR